jgi:archaellum biogenesis ATPase FlaH
MLILKIHEDFLANLNNCVKLKTYDVPITDSANYFVLTDSANVFLNCLDLIMLNCNVKIHVC